MCLNEAKQKKKVFQCNSSCAKDTFHFTFFSPSAIDNKVEGVDYEENTGMMDRREQVDQNVAADRIVIFEAKQRKRSSTNIKLGASID